ncbi:efflux RND transporter permease subunit [Desulfogranum mediterraneum]|uniref:efflux RND transporter permease subunit n=1 Tax=Desulfogranum mediterraneum TaxID=160661 RepID=UPI00040579AB|nr:multidrug efflux RND transporter permease subunit [Desulfogranum mediterraneum]
MLPVFFIKRPIFAMVISLIIVIAGGVCILTLPIQEYPDVTPPTVMVSASYVGANAYAVEESVTRPLEDKINGVKGMIYMQSSSTSTGQATINVYFEPGYDLDIAAVDVQNKVSMATPQLPAEVRQQGVTVDKQSASTVCLVGITGDERYDDKFLSNFATLNILDELRRIPGVGKADNLGEKKYSMRIWLNPDKVKSLGLSPSEIVEAVQAQNRQAAIGRIGASPTFSDQKIEYVLTTRGQLENTDEFGSIIVKYNEDGTLVYLRDVGEIELGSESYDWNAILNQKGAAIIGIYQLPGSNSLQIKQAVVEKMKGLESRFPDGVSWTIPYDTTLFVEVAIDNVVESLFIAVVLVILVILVFLGAVRPTIIAAVAVPVSLIGTFAIMKAFGFSINFLTLFGLILAIGIVVDDVILVVENVERLIHDNPALTIPQVVKEAMLQLTAPIIATTLVLVAVFVPVSFMPGLTGSIYRQFSLTISFSVLISSINALTLSPALAAILIKRPKEGSKKFILFRLFDSFFERVTTIYMATVRLLIKLRYGVILAFFALLGATYWMFVTTPTGFVPEEDKGALMVMLNLKPGSSIEQTVLVRSQVEKMVAGIPGVKDVVMIDGYNILSSTLDASAGAGFISLTPWEERSKPGMSAAEIIKTINIKAQAITDANIAAFNLPGIPGLGTVGGFDFRYQDYLAGDIDTFIERTGSIIQAANQDPRIGMAYTSYAANYPMLYIDIDRRKAAALGVNMAELFTTMQTYLGSVYINDFNKFGKVFRVFAQADREYRSESDDIDRLFVKNVYGQMVPLNTLVKVRYQIGPQNLQHHNMYRSITINGAAAPGFSSGQAMAAMAEITQEKVPGKTFGFDWSGMSYQEQLAGNMTVYVFTFALVVVYLFLCAQYESWMMPVMILLPVPLVMLGALVAQNLAGLDLNLFAQVGLVLLIGMSAKNSILIIEFCKEQREEGVAIIEAATTAARLRFRPIMMTILSFLLGVLPLAFASGAGAMTMRSIGVVIMGGMIAATFVSTLLVPVIYVLLETLREVFVDVEEEVRNRQLL